MKRSTLFLLPVSVLLIALTCAFIQTSETCDAKTLKDNAKAALDPYKYDSGKLTRLYYKKKEQMKELEIPIFVGEKYKVVWNTEGITRPVKVSVFNKDKEAKGRKELYSFTATPGEKIHTYMVDGAKFKFFVDYSLPSVTDSLPPSECMVMMLGYK
ncbi:MAG: hypothetical protein M3R17_10380 [Bacteroidota bacterium]|nr:hypothetical protein [Bacteroidota bacterium]